VYEIRVTKDATWPARARRPDVAMNAETYHKDVREVSAGGVLSTTSTCRRLGAGNGRTSPSSGVPLAKICNENFVGVRNRILMEERHVPGVLARARDRPSR